MYPPTLRQVVRDLDLEALVDAVEEQAYEGQCKRDRGVDARGQLDALQRPLRLRNVRYVAVRGQEPTTNRPTEPESRLEREHDGREDNGRCAAMILPL